SGESADQPMHGPICAYRPCLGWPVASRDALPSAGRPARMLIRYAPQNGGALGNPPIPPVHGWMPEAMPRLAGSFPDALPSAGRPAPQ
ncbi:MAG TPA: hypothetical protein VD833_01420, partial [Vicinamibacterales bacterium]|nr:hypothetical protein [Vicinamibacterales bacterium]